MAGVPVVELPSASASKKREGGGMAKFTALSVPEATTGVTAASAEGAVTSSGTPLMSRGEKGASGAWHVDFTSVRNTRCVRFRPTPAKIPQKHFLMSSPLHRSFLPS